MPVWCIDQAGVPAPVRSLGSETLAYIAIRRLSPIQGTTTMDVRLKPFDFDQALTLAGMRREGAPGKVREEAATPSFSVTMSQALREVSEQQLESQRLQRAVAGDQPDVSIEETMLAMQKAQIGFQATLAVRNRLVQAYTDIMSMPV